MTEKNNSQGPDFWIGFLIIARVFLLLGLWIGLFLAIFMGYFTFPLFLIALLTIIYAISDMGIFLAWRKRRQKDIDERVELLRKYSENLKSGKENHQDDAK